VSVVRREERVGNLLRGSDEVLHTPRRSLRRRSLERATTVPDLLTEAQFDELLNLYHRSQRELDVTCGKARRFLVCPTSIAITLAQRETHKDLLVALGREVPKKWLAAERAAELRKENAIDFNTLEELADAEDCDGVSMPGRVSSTGIVCEPETRRTPRGSITASSPMTTTSRSGRRSRRRL